VNYYGYLNWKANNWTYINVLGKSYR